MEEIERTKINPTHILHVKGPIHSERELEYKIIS
jgi:hypothetical protein